MGESNEGQERRRMVTTRRTKLREAPRGDILTELAAGTRVRVTGDAERKFLPVAVPGAHLRGWIERDDLAAVDDPGDGSRPDDGHGGQTHGEAEHHHGGSGSGLGAPGAGARIAAEARKYVGFPYRWGTHGPDSFDCSGLVYWVLKQATNAEVSWDSHVQFKLGAAVSQDQLQPGDLLFYDTQEGREVREGNKASHVGIYVAPGRMVNALNSADGVKESDPFSPYFRPLYLTARRISG